MKPREPLPLERVRPLSRPASVNEDPAPEWVTPAERARLLGAQGAHLSTGYTTFDTATRGGPRVGDFGVIGGAPGAGKTTWAMNLARELHGSGAHVAILAADEGADGLLIRLGQDLGFARDALERGDESARLALADRLDVEFPRLMLADCDEGHTLESVVDRLMAEAGPEPAVLVVDSLHTVRAVGTAEAQTPRERVDAAVRACKRAAKCGVLVLATSELNRGAYRSRDASERVEDLAAFKESGGIEYGVAFAVVLRNVKDSPDLVDVAFAKNRIGTREDFRLALDRDRACFNEVRRPHESGAEDERERKQRATREKMKQRVLDTLVRNPGITTRNDLARKVAGSKQGVLDALDDLLDERRVAVTDDGVFRIASAEPAGDE